MTRLLGSAWFVPVTFGLFLALRVALLVWMVYLGSQLLYRGVQALAS